MSPVYDFERAALTVDCVVFGLDPDGLQVMLIRRKLEPFSGSWALPGGFVHLDESLEDAARRELREETGLEKVFLEQLYTFGQPLRDPRERVVTVAYYALVNLRDHKVQAATDAAEAAWFPVTALPELAFDHPTIVEVALERLRGKVSYQPIGFELLPPKFSLSQLQDLYEKILGSSLDKRNFRRKVLSYKLLVALDEHEKGVPRRPARLYRFDRRKYKQLSKKGFLFEV